MECFSNKSELKSTFSKVRSFSFEEKKSPLSEVELTNKFLDLILDFKILLKDKTSKIYNTIESIEKITWLDDVDEECLMIINDLISTAKDLHSSLIRLYVAMNVLRKKGIAKDEINDFKNSIDELKEAFSDLESVFFFLPQMPDFVETTKLISLVATTAK